LTSLSLAGNALETIPGNALLPTSITALNLERNKFVTLGDVSLAKTLPALRHLSLKHNRLRATAYKHDGEPDAFPVTLEELDMSSNDISDWSVVDALPTLFPGLKSLRLSHNEIYNSEDAFTTTVARLGLLETLNYSAVCLSC
jgi:Leucine-rich repeat (LRR) protein